MNYNLFLDDIRNPLDAYLYTKYENLKNENWYVVRDYNEFVEFIKHVYNYYGVLPKIISFDHDLFKEHYCPQEMWDRYEEWESQQDFKEKNGYHCAKWLVDFCLDNNLLLPQYQSHSMNPQGRQNILSLLDNFDKFQKKNIRGGGELTYKMFFDKK